MTDHYSKVDEDVEYRLEVAEKTGAGFAVPASVRPMRPRNLTTRETEEAA